MIAEKTFGLNRLSPLRASALTTAAAEIGEQAMGAIVRKHRILAHAGDSGEVDYAGWADGCLRGPE